MEPVGSLPWSQQTASSLYLEPDQSSPRPSNHSVHSTQLYSHGYRNLNWLSLISHFPTNSELIISRYVEIHTLITKIILTNPLDKLF